MCATAADSGSYTYVPNVPPAECAYCWESALMGLAACQDCGRTDFNAPAPTVVESDDLPSIIESDYGQTFTVALGTGEILADFYGTDARAHAEQFVATLNATR